MKVNRFKKLLVLSVIICLIWTAFATYGGPIKGDVVMGARASGFDLQAYVEDMQPGWNLGNSFDAIGGETNWGNPKTTQEMIEAIAASGFKSIRIPVTWHERMGNAPDYTISEPYFARVQEVVDWSLDAGLYVMINMHHDTRWMIDMPTNYDEVIARYEAAWEQIAHYFRDYGHNLIFEGINEPRFDEDWNRDTPQYFELVNELNTTFQQIVRASGGNNTLRPLVISTLTGSASQPRMNALLETIEALDDDRIIATVHYYGFWPFSVNIGSTTFYPEAHQDVIETFDRVHRTFTAKGIPVIIGEYGLLGFDKDLSTIQHGESLKFFEFVTHYGQEKDFLMMLWDNGQHFDRRNLVWRDEALHSLITSRSERSSYTDANTIFVKEGEPLGDVALRLTLHDNTLQSMSHNGSSLQQGVDYEVEGEQLIINSNLLQSLLTEEYGLNASLTLHFSAGIDWQVEVVYYTTPVVSSNDGRNLLVIPTAFNGDRLRTISAVYKNGGNAGPENWTPYMEYNLSFGVSYDGGTIHLLQDFFNEVDDGELDLKLHFQSGEVLEYELSKVGSNIVGRSLAEPDVPVSGDTADEETDESVDAEVVDEALDHAGNEAEQSVVEVEASQLSDTAEERGKLWIVIVIILLIVAIAVSGGLYYRKLRNK